MFVSAGLFSLNMVTSLLISANNFQALICPFLSCLLSVFPIWVLPSLFESHKPWFDQEPFLYQPSATINPSRCPSLLSQATFEPTGESALLPSESLISESLTFPWLFCVCVASLVFLAELNLGRIHTVSLEGDHNSLHLLNINKASINFTNPSHITKGA
jgi:hypothetical protein